jgi:hypothetical protein
MKTLQIVSFAVLLLTAVSRVAVAQDILHFASVAEAVRYVEDENNISDYKGSVFGSEEYLVVLPSGKKVSNWLVNCAFSDAFREFRKESIPVLIDLLGSNAAYLRVGAYEVLKQKAGRYDERSHSQSPDQRRAAYEEWKTWWERNKNNPRLDSPVRRIYPAKDWELQPQDR